MVQEAGCQKSLVIELSLQGHAAVLERMSKQLSTSSPEESAAKRMQEWRGEHCGFSLATFSLGTQSLWLKIGRCVAARAFPLLALWKQHLTAEESHAVSTISESLLSHTATQGLLSQKKTLFAR